MAEKKVIEKREPRVNRRVSLFKRRKKPEIRPLVKEKKNKNYKKLLINIALVIVFLFIVVLVLYIVRNIFLQEFLIEKQTIRTPLASEQPDDNQIKNLIQNHGLDITNIQFSTTSATVTFNINASTHVLITKDKKIDSQLDLVEAIIGQLKADRKEAIYIDLRYNKPIVKIR